MTVLIAGFFIFTYQRKVFVFSNIERSNSENNSETFLLLGKTGKVIGWNQAPDLADAVVLVDYRPKLGVVNLISLPRDLYVNLGGESFKLNEVVSRNKIGDFLDKLPEITGLKTDKFIVVDLDLLKDIVDDLGGIDIKLNSSAIDRVSGYTMEKGQHHLDGEQTVWLVRNRFAPEGDFFREKNQHQIIQALIDKYKNLDSIKKASFLFKITPEITKMQTNINFQELLPLIEKFGNVRFNDVVLDFQTGLLESSSSIIGTSTEYILIPPKGQENYGEIKNFIEGRLEK